MGYCLGSEVSNYKDEGCVIFQTSEQYEENINVNCCTGGSSRHGLAIMYICWQRLGKSFCLGTHSLLSTYLPLALLTILKNWDYTDKGDGNRICRRQLPPSLPLGVLHFLTNLWLHCWGQHCQLHWNVLCFEKRDHSVPMNMWYNAHNSM